MKFNKIMLLSMPAIIALASCHTRVAPESSSSVFSSSEESATSIPSSASESSVSSESSIPSSSSSSRDESELRDEAEEAFAAITSIYNGGTFRMKFDRVEYYFTDWAYLKMVNEKVRSEYGSYYYTTVCDGYFALNDGVIHIGNRRSNYSIYGYATKASSLEESKAILEDDLKPEVFSFNVADWTYVYNTENGFCFKTSSSDIKRVYANLSNDGSEYADFMNDVYLFIDSNLNDIRISPSFESYPSFTSSCSINTFSEEEMEDRYWYYEEWITNPKDAIENGYMDNFNGINRVINGSYGGNNLDNDCPWPSEGNKYWFVRNSLDDNYSNKPYEWDVCFIDTGDIRDSYAAQIEAIDWYWNKVDDNHYTRNFSTVLVDGIIYSTTYHLTLEYTPAAELSRGEDIYTKGIFTIKQRAEFEDTRRDDGWTDSYRSNFDLRNVPFPVGAGSDYIFSKHNDYSYWNAGYPHYTVAFKGVDNTIYDSYIDQLLAEGYEYIDGSYYLIEEETIYAYTFYDKVMVVCHKIDVEMDEGKLLITHDLVATDMFDGTSWSAWHKWNVPYIDQLPLPSNGFGKIGFGGDVYIDNYYLCATLHFGDTDKVNSSSYGNDLLNAGFQWSYTYDCYYKAMDNSLGDPNGIYYYDDNYGDPYCSIVKVYNLCDYYGYYDMWMSNGYLNLTFEIVLDNLSNYYY